MHAAWFLILITMLFIHKIDYMLVEDIGLRTCLH